MNQEKPTGVVVLLHGRSGVGKSTFIDKELTPYAKQKARTLCTASADFFFYDCDRIKYDFDPAKVKDAHAACMRDFIGFLSRPYMLYDLRTRIAPWEVHGPLVVLDNTNLDPRHVEPYLAIAGAFNFNVLHVLFPIPDDIDARNARCKGLDESVTSRQTLAHRALEASWPSHWSTPWVYPDPGTSATYRRPLASVLDALFEGVPPEQAWTR